VEHHLKGCATSIGVVNEMKPFRLHSRALYRESTVFAFGAADPMVAMLVVMAGGEYLKNRYDR
jgi:hypothetical protein